MGLGQLAAHRGGTVAAERLGHRDQGGLGAVRRLEEDHRPLLPRQRGQTARPLAGLAGQEALEAEAVDRQPADGESSEYGAGPGHGGDPDVVLDRGHDEAVARVGDARHPGVGDQHHAVAGEQRLEQHGGAGLLVALEVGHHATGDRDADVGAEALEPSGVLRGHDVRAGELGGQPGRRVAVLADRGAREDQDSRHGAIIAGVVPRSAAPEAGVARVPA